MASRLVRPITAVLVALLAIVALVAAAAVTAAPASANPTADTYFYISSLGPTYAPGDYFGEYGAGPNGIATDSAGNVYVTIPRGFVKYYASGALACVYTGDNGYTAGSSYGLDVDSSGNVYYADRTNHLIAKLHPDYYGVSGYVYHWVSLTGKDGSGTPLIYGDGGDLNIGTGGGEFNFPNDVAVDGHYLYVTDTLNHRVQKFETATGDNSLSWRATWGKTGGGSGSGDGEFNKPRGIAADGHGHIFVTEETNRRVQELTTSGAFVTKWGVTSPSTDPLYLYDPVGIDVDTGGDVYVTDLGNATSWVDKFRPSGSTYALVTRIGSWGTADAQFQFPWSSAVAPNGYLWVTDTQNYKVKRFARDATPPDATVSGIPVSWTRFSVNVTIGATDPTVAGQYTSGVGSREYSLTGAAPWTTYAAPFAITAEGDTAVTYRATDLVGNVSTPATAHVRIDKSAPSTGISGVADRWSNTAVRATLTPIDTLSSVASTEYRVDGGPWTSGTSVELRRAIRHKRAGLPAGGHLVEYRSTDVAGNVEATKSCMVTL